LPAFERAIFFVGREEDATVEPWHDEREREGVTEGERSG
jgi:hypothetical protein